MDNKTAQNKNTKAVDLETLLTKLEGIEASQDRSAQVVGSMDERLAALEARRAPEAVLEALAPKAKGGVLGNLKQSTTTRKVVVATVATAAVAGVAYAGYRGVEIMKARKAEAPLLSVAHVEPQSTVTKREAINQGLGIK